MKTPPTPTSWKKRLHEIIYEADTKAGKLFDIVLLYTILASILLVMLESVASIKIRHESAFNTAEWVFTILFSVEYLLRIIAISKPKKYIFSFFGVIDLLATIPMYLSFIFVGSHSLIALRALRLLRVFRILKLARFIGEADNFMKALKASRAKIIVFLFFITILAIILGTVMYMVEGEANGFTSIPRSIYWAIVTLTTVGYGDIAPHTPLGQFIASIIMVLGYGIIAIPTGIVSAEFVKSNVDTNTQSCANCAAENHKDNASFCNQCGYNLH